ACEQIVRVASQSIMDLNWLAEKFPEPFREIAEESAHFPCLFPAHPEDLPSMQRFICDKLNLGKRCWLKVRPVGRRKTFSKKTWVNQLVLDLLRLVYELAYTEIAANPGKLAAAAGLVNLPRDTLKYRDLACLVSLAPKNAKTWPDTTYARRYRD